MKFRPLFLELLKLVVPPGLLFIADSLHERLAIGVNRKRLEPRPAR